MLGNSHVWVPGVYNPELARTGFINPTASSALVMSLAAASDWSIVVQNGLGPWQ